MTCICNVCGWRYDEAEGYLDGGILPGTKWEEVREDFECPLCAMGRGSFCQAKE